MIDDKEIEAALHSLRDSDRKISVARHDLVLAEEWLKHQKAEAYLESEGANVKEREARALVSEKVKEAGKAYAQAAGNFEFLRMKRETHMATIEAWRTQSSNQRANI